MPLVLVPEAYRGPTQGVAAIEVDAETVKDCLTAADQQHPGFLALILDDAGKQHRFVKLFVNEEQLAADALDTAIDAGDRLEVLAAIAGG
jgi:sulfur carrier protein ThiS